MSSRRRLRVGVSSLLLSLFFALKEKKGSAFIASPSSTVSQRRVALRGSSTEHFIEEARTLENQSLELRAEVYQLETELRQQKSMRQLQHRRETFNELVEERRGQKGVGSENLAKFLGYGVSTRDAASVLDLHGFGKDGLLSFQEFEPDRLGEALEYVQNGDRAMRRKFRLAQEKIESEQKLLQSLPVPNIDFRLETRCLAALPYLLPLASTVCLVGFEHPTALAFALAFVPLPLLSAWLSWHWVIALVMARVANQRRLPLVLRFNLQQAFVVDFLFMLFAEVSLWIGGRAQDAEASEPSLFLHALLVCTFGCIAYAVIGTLLGSIPDGIFFVSAQARQSLGRMRPRKLAADEDTNS